MKKLRLEPYNYPSLHDFLVATPLEVDGIVQEYSDDLFFRSHRVVKGREVSAAVLFADITNFTALTFDRTPIETLIFVNGFFDWIGQQALGDCGGIVDKYVGDEIMIVFAKEFGAVSSPFDAALNTACRMVENNPFGYVPHIGIASGRVVIGYVGSPRRFDCSVFGSPVTLAARCAKRDSSTLSLDRAHITAPEAHWDQCTTTRVLLGTGDPKWTLSEVEDGPQTGPVVPKVRRLRYIGETIPLEIAKGKFSASLSYAMAELKAAKAFRPRPITLDW